MLTIALLCSSLAIAAPSGRPAAAVKAPDGHEPGAAHDAEPEVAPTHADVAYGAHERNVLDLYLPDAAAHPGPYPVAFYIHGGGFRVGDKSIVLRDSAKQVRRLLEQGIAVAATNYRYSTDAPFPAPMHDAARALQFLRHHAEAYNLKADRVVAWGGSAGGGIALWLAFHDDLADPEAADPVLRESTRLTGAAGSAAQTTYDPFVTNAIFPGIHAERTEMYQAFFLGASKRADGAEALADPGLRPVFAEASPDTHVSPDDPPVYLAYQTDVEVTAETPAGTWVHDADLGRSLADRLDEAGVPYVLAIKEQPRRARGGVPDGGVFEFVAALLLGP